MNDRVQAYLDGEIPRNQLSDGERARVAEVETATTSVAAALRGVRAPDLTGAVMRGLPSAPPARYEWPAAPANPFSWLTKPRSLTLTVRPAFLMAAAAAVAAFFLVPVQPRSTSDTGVVAYAAPEAPLVIQFRLEVANAQKVSLAGTFTGWEALYELAQVGPGQWSVLVPLAPGVHDYVFIVDGERRVVDPYARRAEGRDGLTVSRLFLTRPKAPVARPTRVVARPDATPGRPLVTDPKAPGFGEER